MKIKILMIDDHQSMIEGYKAILGLNDNYSLEVTSCNTARDAFSIITNKDNSTVFDIVFLDYSMAAFEEEKIFSGEDLGVLIRQHMPNTKIIMLTAHSDAIRLYNFAKKIQPNGLLVKSDFTAPELLTAFEKVLAGEIYYSPLAKKSVNEPLFTSGSLDNIDREIIVLLAEGLQIKSIAQQLNVSEDSIKKRKSKIKDVLGLDKSSDEDILKQCRVLGLL